MLKFLVFQMLRGFFTLVIVGKKAKISCVKIFYTVNFKPKY